MPRLGWPRLLIWLCSAVAAAWPIETAWFWLSGDVGNIGARLAGGPITTPALGLGTRFAGLSSFAPACGLAAYALLRTGSLVRRFAAGDFFSLAARRDLRRIGLAASSAALLDVAGRTVATLILTVQNPPGQRLLVFAIDDVELVAIFAGGLALTMHQALTAGAALVEDNDAFI